MRTEISVDIDRPLEDVFRLTNDNVAAWSEIVVEDQTIHKAPDGGVGTTFRTITEENGRRMEFVGKVTHWDPPNASAIEMVGDKFDLDVAYSFEDLGGRTRVTQVSDVRGKGLTKVIFVLFGWAMRKSGCDAAQKELNRLKSFCEQHSQATA